MTITQPILGRLQAPLPPSISANDSQPATVTRSVLLDLINNGGLQGQPSMSQAELTDYLCDLIDTGTDVIAEARVKAQLAYDELEAVSAVLTFCDLRADGDPVYGET